MFTHLRSLRRKLLPGADGRRYLLYATGEMLLVVTGILIALSIDNWNNRRIEQLELHGYLQNIANNIENDREQLELMLDFRRSVRAKSAQVMRIAQQERISVADFDLLIDPDYNVFFDRYLEINSSGFDALKSSGYLGKLQNTRIEQLLYDYYSRVSAVAKQESSLNTFIENLEVLGFEDGSLISLIKIARVPDGEQYLADHQKEVLEMLNSPALFGSHFRGAIESEIEKLYEELRDVGVAIQEEVAAMLRPAAVSLR